MCAAYRVPHSEFLGWPDADRDKAIWHHLRTLERQAETCQGCATRARDWDPRHGGHPAAYIADTYRCEGCHQRHQASKDLTDPAMHVRLKPNPQLQAGPDRPQKTRKAVRRETAGRS